MGVKIYTNLVGQIMLMIFPLNWIELILSSSKDLFNVNQDPFIEYAIFESCSSRDALVYGLRISALLNEL